MIDCSTIQEDVKNVLFVQHCDRIASGALRLLTPFQYSNGAQIDLFLEGPEPLSNTLTLSDLGQTTGYLLDLQVRPWATNKRRQIIEDICRSLNVSWRGGRLSIELGAEDLKNLAPPMMRLAQACIRVSGLAVSARIWSAGSFQDEMEEFLDSLELSYEQDVIESGKRNQEVKFDFRVHGETTTSLIQSLSAASASSAHSIATEAFVRLYDIGAAKAKSGRQYVTVVDESHNVFKEYDVERLNSLSSVFWFPAEQEQLTAALVS